MSREELKKFLIDFLNKSESNRGIVQKLKMLGYDKYILKYTEQIEDINLAGRIYCIINDIEKLPLCITCGKEIKIKYMNSNQKLLFCHKNCSISLHISDEAIQFQKDCSYDEVINFVISNKKLANRTLKTKLFEYSLLKSFKKYIHWTDSFYEMKYCYINNIKEIPKCSNCNKDVNFIVTKGYNRFCSDCNSVSAKKVYVENYYKLKNSDKIFSKEEVIKKLHYIIENSEIYKIGQIVSRAELNKSLKYFTSFLDKFDREISTSERIFNLINGIDEAYICPVCKTNIRTYNGLNKGYNPYCGIKCWGSVSFYDFKTEEELKIISQKKRKKWQNKIPEEINNMVQSIYETKKKNGSFGTSPASQKFFWYMIEGLESSDMHFEELNKEKRIGRKFADFCFENKIIEFNGDKVHANPKKYKADDIVDYQFYNNIKAQTIWDKDFKRSKFLESEGYEILVIWASECQLNKEKIRDKCLNFLKVNKIK